MLTDWVYSNYVITLMDNESGKLEFECVSGYVIVEALHCVINYYGNMNTKAIMSFMKICLDEGYGYFTSMSNMIEFLKQEDERYSEYGEQLEKYMVLV